MRIFIATATIASLWFAPVAALGNSDGASVAHTASYVRNIADEKSNQQQEIVEAQAQEEKLPDEIDSSISNDAVVVSSNYVMQEDGTLVYANNGEKVTDTKIIGTAHSVPDPLARTGGQTFIPVSVKAAREVKDDTTKDSNTEAIPESAPSQEDSSEQDDSRDSIQLSSFTDSSGKKRDTSGKLVPNNSPDNNTSVENVGNWVSKWGAYWSTYNGQKAFFDQRGTLFAAPARQVIDVSAWQGTINWDAVKADGVEGAIIRVGYGSEQVDATALRNIREARRVGIPIGVYLYSYASDGAEAWQEGANVVRILRQAGITNSSQMSLPIYYDLENWSYSGNKAPTSPQINDAIVNNFFMSVQLSGFAKVNVYSYTSLLNSALNTANIHSRTNWVATYGSRLSFAIQPYERGWQYTSSGSVNGISGNVDLNAFRFAGVTPSSDTPNPAPSPNPAIQIGSYPLVDIPSGEYYINARVKDSSSIDIMNASRDNGARIHLYHYNNSNAQIFRFIRNPNNTYTISNLASGKLLDVRNATAQDNQTVWQYDANGSRAQEWYIRDVGNGWAIQSALGNFVLDIAQSATADGTQITLRNPSQALGQRFVLASANPLGPANNRSIRSVANRHKTLDIYGASQGNAAAVQLYTFNRSAAQNFSFKQVGNGVYEVINKNSQKALDVVNASSANGSKVQQYTANGSQAQHWAALWSDGSQLMLASMLSGKVLDLPNGSTANMTRLQVYTPNFSAAQKWDLRGVNDEPKDEYDIEDGEYVIHSAMANNLVLDVYGGNSQNGANVWLYTNNHSLAQIWRITNNDDGSVTFINKLTGKALDIVNGATQPGANVDIYSYNGSAAQKWALRAHSRGQFIISSWANRTNVLDVYNGALRSGSNVWSYTGNNSAAQMWKLEKVS